MTNFLNVII